MKVNSRIDALNYIMLFVIIGALALPNFAFEFSWIYFGVMLVVDILVMLIVFTTSYELTDERLVVKTALIKFDVKYDRITGITKVNNIFNPSCGTAVKCIQIKFGEGINSVYNKFNISPENEDKFLEILLKKCPNVDEIGDRRKKKVEKDIF